MSVFVTKPVFLVLFAAFGYAVATLMMKLTASSNNYFWLALVALFLTSAVVTEIIILRQVKLSVAYITILGIETLLVLSFAVYIGEGFNSKEAFGAALVLGGMVMLSV